MSSLLAVYANESAIHTDGVVSIRIAVQGTGSTMTNAARLWIEAPSDQKRRLQAVFFPEGIQLTDGVIGTAVTCMAFSQLREIAEPTEGLTSPGAPSWNQIVAFLRQIQELQAIPGSAT